MKKWFMRQYWRIQQSQTLISMGFWTATLTLLIWPYVRWRPLFSGTFLGIATTYWGLFAIGASVLLTVLLIGRFYDATLGLWREHLTVVQERNPFTTYKLNPPFGILLAQTNAILRRMEPEDEKIQRHCDFVDRWLEWNSREEIWARTMSSWKNIVGDEDPFLFYLDEESRSRLETTADELQDY
jgi:hypothetical protein